MSSVHPHALGTPPVLKVPAPSNSKLSTSASEPSPMGKTWTLIWPERLPPVVTCNTMTCRLSSGSALPASFSTNQDEPTIMLAASWVAPLSAKKGVKAWSGSSAMAGSAAPSMPDVEAGPVNPMVAYVSSAISGNWDTNAGFKPAALQDVLKPVLNAPSGTLTNRGCSELPNTALNVSLLFTMFTKKR